MRVRLAHAGDLDVLMEMGVAMHAESRFRVHAMNRDKTRASMKKIIASPVAGCILLAEASTGAPAGMLAGYVVDYFFSDALVAQDSYFFVKPEFRGSTAALKLLIAFRHWAENRQAAELCINMMRRHRPAAVQPVHAAPALSLLRLQLCAPLEPKGTGAKTGGSVLPVIHSRPVTL